MTYSSFRSPRPVWLAPVVAGFLVLPGAHLYAEETATPATSNLATTPTQESETDQWLRQRQELKEAFAAARGRDKESSPREGLAILSSLANDGDGEPADPIAWLAIALQRISPPAGQKSPELADLLELSILAQRPFERARSIALNTQDPLALAIVGHATAIGLGTTRDQALAYPLLRDAFERREPYAAVVLHRLFPEKTSSKELEQAAKLGEVEAKILLLESDLKSSDRNALKRAGETLLELIPNSLLPNQAIDYANRLKASPAGRSAVLAVFERLAELGADVKEALADLGSDKAPSMGWGDELPPVPTMEWLRGDAQTLKEALGSKPIVIEFWATWCPPCVASLPKLNELAKKYEGRVAFVAISDEDPSTIMQFLKRRESLGETFPVASDTEAQWKNPLFSGFGLRGIPSAFVIGSDGKIAWDGHPMGGLEKAIETALKTPQTPSSKTKRGNILARRYLRIAQENGGATTLDNLKDELKNLRPADRVAAGLIIAREALSSPDDSGRMRLLKLSADLLETSVDPETSKNFEEFEVLGKVQVALDRKPKAEETFTAALRVLARHHPDIERIRNHIEELAPAPTRGLLPDATATPNTPSQPARPSLAPPRGTPIVVSPRGTPISVAPRGTPIIVAPRGTPITVAPRGTPLGLAPQASDRATTISVERAN